MQHKEIMLSVTIMPIMLPACVAIISSVIMLSVTEPLRHNETRHNDIRNKNAWHNNKNGILRRYIMLSVMYVECRKHSHYEKCRYAKCCGTV
jgi:hypothetical protein